MIVHREADSPSVAWKNGAGTTRELHRQPPHGTEFDWRLSLATIERAAPFSPYSGYARTLVLVAGDGLRLQFAGHGQVVLASAGEIARFDCDWQTNGELLGGPSRDLNLIVARERAESVHQCAAVSEELRVPTAGWDETLVCCLSGDLQLRNACGETLILGAVDVACCTAADGIVSCQPYSTAAGSLFVASLRRLDSRADPRATAQGPSGPPA